MNKKKHPLYYVWNGMMYRCYKPYHSHYKYYGAKGVTVCERWHEFENFVDDINNKMENGHLLYNRKYQLDKDKNGGNIYSPENCVVTLAEVNENEARNKQRKKVIAYKGTKETIFESVAQTSKYCDIPRQTIMSCMKRGSRHKQTGYYFKYAD